MVTASAGEEIELECIVSGGNPPAKISWFVGSKTIRYVEFPLHNSVLIYCN